MYLFLAVLGLRCCARALSSCVERGLLFLAVHGLLIAVASLVAEHGLQACGLRAAVVVARRLSSCGARAQLLRGMWDLPGPGLKPASPALAGGFLTTAPPGKPYSAFTENLLCTTWYAFYHPIHESYNFESIQTNFFPFMYILSQESYKVRIPQTRCCLDLPVTMQSQSFLLISSSPGSLTLTFLFSPQKANHLSWGSP